jgi:hypothetical protein
VRTACDPGGAGIGVRLSREALTTVTLLRPGEQPARASRSCTIADYQTNARLLQYGTRGPQLVSLAIADASHALARQDGLLSAAADEAIEDLHLAIHDDALVLTASRPAPRLRLQGGALGAVRRLRLNGREVSAARHRRETLIVSPGDWAEGEPEPEPEHESGAENVEPRTASSSCAA